MPHKVSILCQSRLFLLHEPSQASSPFSYFVSILCQSRLFLLLGAFSWQNGEDTWYPSSVNRGYFSYWRATASCWCSNLSIHPLSIEAISPTFRPWNPLAQRTGYPSSVNRGYFSYIFFLLPRRREEESIHPLSIEAISPTEVNLNETTRTMLSIHPLSIEAISPTHDADQIRYQNP